MPPRGIPNPAELARITNLLTDFPEGACTGARFTRTVARVVSGIWGATKLAGALSTLGIALNPVQVDPACQAQP